MAPREFTCLERSVIEMLSPSGEGDARTATPNFVTWWLLSMATRAALWLVPRETAQIKAGVIDHQPRAFFPVVTGLRLHNTHLPIRAISLRLSAIKSPNFVVSITET